VVSFLKNSLKREKKVLDVIKSHNMV